MMTSRVALPVAIAKTSTTSTHKHAHYAANPNFAAYEMCGTWSTIG